MKITMLAAAGLLAAGTITVTAAPADAQRHRDGRGWHGDRSWHGDRGWRDGRGWRGDRRWHRGREWRGGYRWNRGPRWGNRYGRVVCRGGYYNQRCFRVR